MNRVSKNAEMNDAPEQEIFSERRFSYGAKAGNLVNAQCDQASKGPTHEIPQLVKVLQDRQMQSLESLAALHKKLNPILRAQPTSSTDGCPVPATTDLGKLLCESIALTDQFLKALSEIHDTLEL